MGTRTRTPSPPPPKGPSLLSQWLESSGTSQDTLAATLKVTPSAVSKWLSGENAVDLRQSLLIHELTNGDVPFWTFGHDESLLLTLKHVVADAERR